MVNTDLNQFKNTREKGSFFENLVRADYVKNGAKVLAQNLNFLVGELDLVLEEVTEGGKVVLVFVEVRASLKNPSVSRLIESVHYQKRVKLEKAARMYLVKYKGIASEIRWDIATVTPDLGMPKVSGPKNQYKINLLKNAF